MVSKVPFTFREFRKEDIPETKKIIRSTLGLVDSFKAKKEFYLGLRKDPKFSICKRFVILLHGKIIGLFGVYLFSVHPKNYLGVDWFAIKKEYQRKGIGSSLVKEMSKISRKLHKRNLFVWADKHAVGFYIKTGFKLSNKKILPKEGDYFMIKKL
ncbi:Acetyltransferase (GNAT) domain protein [uncultured archaeon]|nr:Acetyltransferase (GNAT) domain protein [uncultured archaeon]